MSWMMEFKNMLSQFGLEAFNKYYGCYRGFIADNVDPQSLGRLKLKVPQVYGEEVMDYWAFSKGMPVGKQIGMYAIPNIGDMV